MKLDFSKVHRSYNFFSLLNRIECIFIMWVKFVLRSFKRSHSYQRQSYARDFDSRPEAFEICSSSQQSLQINIGTQSNGILFFHDFLLTLHDFCVISRLKLKQQNLGLHSLHYSGAALWNKLPSDLKQIIDIENFKSLLKTWDGPSCKCGVCTLCKIPLYKLHVS